MAYEDLIKSIETAADEKNKEIIRNTELEIDEILQKAETESTAIRSQYLEKARQTLLMESNRQIFRAHQDVKYEISQIKEDIINRAFVEGLKELENIRMRSDYTVLYSCLIQDIISALPDEDVTLHIDPADKEVCRKILLDFDLSCKVEEDFSTPFGLYAVCSDGRLVAHNNMDSRVSAIREACGMEINSILFGEPDG